jgi:hypothetical protein
MSLVKLMSQIQELPKIDKLRLIGNRTWQGGLNGTMRRMQSSRRLSKYGLD